MKFFTWFGETAKNQDDVEILASQIKDYCDVGLKLLWQRQMIFTAALTLQAYYYSWKLALITLFLLIVTETFDYRLFKRASMLTATSPKQVIRTLWRIRLSTLLSAGIISFFAMSIAVLQGLASHFMPLFFLFAAALFAAMNNHQILSVLALRLAIYGIVFLAIPLRDILQTGASLASELWIQMFTSIFVLYFIIDCSRIYLELYRANAEKLRALKAEHAISVSALAAKSEFLATISHELRTPLTSIKGSLDLVNSGALGPVPQKFERVLNIAQQNSERLKSLINELLDLQQMESSKMKFVFQPVQMKEVVSSSIARTRPFAESLGIDISSDDIDESIHIHADASRLEQVITNMLSNAAKFSNRGDDVYVRVVANPSIICLQIVDKGIGLSEEHRAKVFDRFSQLDSSDKRKVSGTGLGMNISKAIMEAHNGKIDYFRNADKGTTFYIEMPRTEAPSNSGSAETVNSTKAQVT
ncbi:sensor histidine kinase [Roseibium sp.]|uniref:sensor histidine kinase n=1 Tax=Roseibium sp. TaxID=1936156 RepID=UPI003A96FF24